MLKNYPSAYLFLLSLVAFLVIIFSAPIIGSWNIYCSVGMEVFKFTIRVVLLFFLGCAVVEATHSLLFRNHHHH